MKLVTALTKLKNIKSQIARVDGYIDESTIHYENDIPPHDFLTETNTRHKLISEARALKVLIMQTNASTVVPFNDNKPVSLNDLILLNAEIRSELAHWTKLLALKCEEENRFTGRTTETIKKIFATGYNKSEIKVKLNQLEKTKEQVEAVLLQANMETDLVG